MASLFKIVCALIRHLTGLYRPERHYMRGPGPACRAKHPEARDADRLLQIHRTSATVAVLR